MNDKHRLDDLRSIELHRACVNTLRENPPLLDSVINRLQLQANEDDDSGRWFASRWLYLLIQCKDLDDLERLVTEDSERMCQLRQCSPFAGLITQERRLDTFLKFEK